MVAFTLKAQVQSVREGGILTFSVSIVNPNYRDVSAYKIYLRTHETAHNGAAASDYDEIYSLRSLTFTAKTPQTYTFNIGTTQDDRTEGTEYFSVALYDHQKKFLGIEKVFTIRDTPLADLSVGTLKVGHASVSAGGEIRISWSVGNDGPGEAKKNTGLFYLSRDDRFDKNVDVRLDAAVSIRGLDDDERTSGTVTLKIPDDWPKGKSYIIFIADAEGDVRETVEANNSTSVAIDVRKAAPQPWAKVNAPLLEELPKLISENVGSGWTKVSAAELGLKNNDSIGGVSYSFAGGVYRGEIPGDKGVATAIIVRAELGGQKTLVIAFPGSSRSEGDIGDWLEFDTHYAKFAPLVRAIRDYAEDGGAERIVLTGHSLGAAMVDNFFADHGGDIFEGVTFGSPGGSNGNIHDTKRLLNFAHTDDWAIAAAGTVPNYDQHGKLVHINTGLQDRPRRMSGNRDDEHDLAVYVQSLDRLRQFAADDDSPFYYSGLGSALRKGVLYGGSDAHVAISTTTGGNYEIRLEGSDRWALGTVTNDTFYWFSKPSISWSVSIDGGGLRRPRSAGARGLAGSSVPLVLAAHRDHERRRIRAAL